MAAGAGNRVDSTVPKQFIEIAGTPLLMHTINRFYNTTPQANFIIVVPEKYIQMWKELCVRHSFSVKHTIAEGGLQRYHSVKNGLALIKNEGLVAIHDGVRPFVSPDVIKKTFDEAEKKGNAIPCIPVSDSLRLVQPQTNKPVDRKQYKIIQTPQCFVCSLIKQAYLQPFQEFFTDDASLVEAMGVSINLVEGNVENFKVTYPSDVLFAESLLKKKY